MLVNRIIYPISFFEYFVGRYISKAENKGSQQGINPLSWFPVSVNRRHPPPSFQSLHKREVSLIELSTVVGHKNRDFYFPEAIIREQITSTHLMPSHHSSTKGIIVYVWDTLLPLHIHPSIQQTSIPE